MGGATLWDARACTLGEGPLWHPTRKQLFWFDILGKKLLSRDGDTPLEWEFDEIVSAAGWVSDDQLLIASESSLSLFNLDNGARQVVAPLEADDTETRSNDGRADPWGGFWISTMSKTGAPAAGAIYRYYRGELRALHPGVSVPNAICFSPDRRYAYFADTLSGQIMRQPLAEADGWPSGPPKVWLDLTGEKLLPDGAVTDAAGNLWNAQWGASRVAQYSPEGVFLQAVAVPAAHSSCPAFGGPDLTTLFCTSAQEHLSPAEIADNPCHGQTFVASGYGPGLAEPQVRL